MSDHVAQHLMRVRSAAMHVVAQPWRKPTAMLVFRHANVPSSSPGALAGWLEEKRSRPSHRRKPVSARVFREAGKVVTQKQVGRPANAKASRELPRVPIARSHCHPARAETGSAAKQELAPWIGSTAWAQAMSAKRGRRRSGEAPGRLDRPRVVEEAVRHPRAAQATQSRHSRHFRRVSWTPPAPSQNSTCRTAS